MLNRNRKLIFGFIIVFSMVLSGMIGMNNVSAAESSDGTETMKEIIVQDTGKNDSYNRIGLISQRNSFSDVRVDGTQPGKFNFVDNDNSTIGTPITCEDQRSYPYNIGNINYLSNNRVMDPWDRIDWMHIDNVDPIEGSSAHYNISLETNNLGDLDEDSQTEYQIPNINVEIYELHLNIFSSGMYVLNYENDVLNSYWIVSDNNMQINTLAGDLPLVSSGGSPIGQYIAFFAVDPGDYRMYFSANAKHVSFNLKHIGNTEKLNYGDRVIYRDEKSDDVDPGNILGSTNGLPVQLYSFDVSAGDFLQHNFGLIWGASSGEKIRLLLPSPSGYQFQTINTADINDFTFVPYSGKAYLMVINQNYYEWTWAGVPIKNLLYYTFSIDKISTMFDYEIGSSRIFKVNSDIGKSVIKFEINETSYIYFNAEKIAENPGFRMLDGNPSTTFMQVDEQDGVIYQQYLVSANGHYLYRFTPGTYYAEITHPGTTINSAFLQIDSQILPMRNALNHKEFTLLDNDLQYIEKSNIDFVNNELDPIPIGGSELFPQIFPFTYSNDLDYGLNISCTRADNPSLYDNDFRFNTQLSVFEESRYNNKSLTSMGVLHSGIGFNINSGTSESNSYSTKLFLASYSFLSGIGKGIVSVFPYNVEINNGTDWIPYDHNLKLRIGTTDSSRIYDFRNTNIIHSVGSQIDDIDYSSLNYSITGSYNSSEKGAIFLAIKNNETMNDWWQFSISLNNSAGPSFAYLVYDNVWVDNSGPNKDNLENLPEVSSVNSSFERGLSTGNFSILIGASSILGDMVDYKINIARYNVSILTSPVISGEFKKGLTYFMKNNSWVLPTSIGGGVAIIVVIGVLIIRKKKSLYK